MDWRLPGITILTICSFSLLQKITGSSAVSTSRSTFTSTEQMFNLLSFSENENKWTVFLGGLLIENTISVKMVDVWKWSGRSKLDFLVLLHIISALHWVRGTGHDLPSAIGERRWCPSGDKSCKLVSSSFIHSSNPRPRIVQKKFPNILFNQHHSLSSFFSSVSYDFSKVCLCIFLPIYKLICFLVDYFLSRFLHISKLQENFII